MINYSYDFSSRFAKRFNKLDHTFQIKAEKQINKIIENPFIGKPMKNNRKGTREVYLSPFRISYYIDNDDAMIYFLNIYHKDEQ